MRRTKKESIPVSIRMDKHVFDALVKHCEVSGQSKTVAIERAIMSYIKRSKTSSMASEEGFEGEKSK